ncbi:DNA-binding transcriptional regulator, XRE-family HTH domain [Amphibacillus marinus]|uniref:DNA-binding transcriptional regulator, XRE-family HTH domain n=1 Tax=Amphibacillus marinus TaxID=872970 RepID=A0A1H8LBD3_9BACI|nr:helix-turn-helix transcriptional regulator [Amphibacillus marinus]SEO02028.1 DNA-binding transcriptional regulator, XRE-family HTH domain [Amphibacillus marinus]
MKFEERIYEFRKKGGFTQEEIANKLNVSRQTISNWETGTAQPTINKAIELANLYGISMNELVGVTEQAKQKSEVLSTLIHRKATIYLNPESDADIFLFKTALKHCEIIEVQPSSIRIIMQENKQMIEKLLFVKDIIGFEIEEED